MIIAHSGSVGTGRALAHRSRYGNGVSGSRDGPAKSQGPSGPGTVSPTVMPAASMTVPTNVEFAPSVVALTGAQNTLHASAPFWSRTVELAAEFSAAADTPVPGLKM